MHNVRSWFPPNNPNISFFCHVRARPPAEISILKHLHHSNIVHLIEVFHSRTNLALVFEFLDQDLHNYINVCSSEGIDDYTTRSFLFQLLQGKNEKREECATT